MLGDALTTDDHQHLKVKFLHVPKTAGASVRNFLHAFFPKAEICPAIHPHELREIPPGDLGRYRVFAGHYDWSYLDAVEGESFTFTVLRHPVERLLSYYLFLRRRGSKLSRSQLEAPAFAGMRAAVTMSPDEYFCGAGEDEVRFHSDDLNDNFYAYYLAGRSFGARAWMRGESDAAIVSLALSNLTLIDRVYLTHDLAGLEADLSSMFGRGAPRNLSQWWLRRAGLRGIRVHDSRTGLADKVSRL